MNSNLKISIFKSLSLIIILIAIIAIISTIANNKNPAKISSTPIPSASSATTTINNQTSASKITLIGPLPSTLEIGQIQKISWKSENYQPNTVTVRLIRKTTDMPAKFELVRVIAMNTTNDGLAVWVPAKTDIGDNLFIEIGCDHSTVACTTEKNTSSLAVIYSDRYTNTASVFEAQQMIQAENN